MIPCEVTAIASLIWPHWEELDYEDPEDREAREEILAGAWRIYEAGYRRSPQENASD